MTWPKVQQGRLSRTRNKILGQRRLPRGSVAKTWRLSDPSDPSSPSSQSSGYTGDFVHGEQEGDGSFENAEEGRRAILIAVMGDHLTNIPR